ncbi:MAG: SDR family oxidoreductase [Clostridium sp.]|jgi:3-oxoacyl-[acyl-carrier protein] reductase|nr:SDR family oxidoreductase [Clostridium sp.]
MAEEKTLNAIVTGARRGIGRAIVELFAQKGINIWACASKENEEFEQDMKQLSEEYHVWIKPVYFDLANEEETTNALKEVIKEKQPIDILVNNAGVPYGNLMQMTPLKNLREVMEINFIAQIHVMQLISRVMMRQKSGSIINMGSVGGIEAREGYLAYGSSKAALLWATRSVSKELAKYNIRVNAVAPGLVESDMGMYKKTEEQEKILNEISMKRMGRPEEIAEAVYFLATDASSFMTGAIMNVDGGRLR